MNAALSWARRASARGYQCGRGKGAHKVGLGADFQRDPVEGRLGVVDCLCTSLDILRDLVVVAGTEGGEVPETVQGDGVFGSGESDGTGISGDRTRSDIVGGLGTDEEAISTDDSVRGERGTLCVCPRSIHEQVGRGGGRHLEEIHGRAGVQTRLLVDGGEDGGLLSLGRVQRGRQVEFESLGDEVLELDLGPKEVGGGPCLCGSG